jgi:hypothetical protein
LFNEGDPNLRHSINGIGQFYKLEAIPLVIGIIMFFVSKVDRKLKFLMAFWVLAGVAPSVITRDGGNHATRLILILPPLAFLISYGLLEIFRRSRLIRFGYAALFAISFGFFIHNYFVHSPWDTERWWHYGWQQAISYVKDNQQNYDKVVISSSDEPPWVFFAAWYPYPPQEWQKNFPIGNDVDLSGFGKVSHIDKFYFGSPGVKGVYEWGKVINKNILYLASAKEVNVNLIMEPERTPTDLKLLKAVAYPSGEPAFYLFTGK